MESGPRSRSDSWMLLRALLAMMSEYCGQSRATYVIDSGRSAATATGCAAAPPAGPPAGDRQQQGRRHPHHRAAPRRPLRPARSR